METQVTEMIMSLGFPIVMCLGMAWFVYYMFNKNQEEISNMNQIHREEMNQITEALNNNTVALTRLCDRIGKGDENA